MHNARSSPNPFQGFWLLEANLCQGRCWFVLRAMSSSSSKAVNSQGLDSLRGLWQQEPSVNPPLLSFLLIAEAGATPLYLVGQTTPWYFFVTGPTPL